MNRPVVPRIDIPPMSIEAFEAWVARQDGRYELVRGRPMMMNQTTRYHSRITANLLRGLLNAIDMDTYDVASGDFGLQTGEDTIRLADIMVTPAAGSGKERRTNDAVLLVEVLSPSTYAEDFGPKSQEYLAVPDLQAYLIVAQDSACVWLWQRGENGFPDKPDVIEDRDAEIRIDALGLTLPVGQIYRNVDL
jgi:Uma2 family endonuclease